MKRIITYLIASLLFVSGKNPDKDLYTYQNIEWLLGEWDGNGQLFGNEASFEMIWRRVLNDQFLELTFQNKYMTKQGGSRTMNARAFYKHENDSINGHWFDTRGVMLLLKGNVVADTVTILWGSDNTEQGKTIYQKVDGEIRTIDFYLKERVYHQFGNATYKKRI